MVRKTGLGIWVFLAISGIGVGCFSAFDNFYFHDRGYAVVAIGALTATFNISVAVAELPSAMIFDRRSHWAAIQMGNGLRFVGLVLFFLAFGAWSDFAAEAIAGIGAAAMSGTSIAFILNRIGDVGAHDRRKIIGLVAVLGSAASLLGGGIGRRGFLREPRLIWGLGALFMGIAGLCFFLWRPKDRTSSQRHLEPLRSYLIGLGAIARHPRAWLSIAADAALVAPFLLWQLRLGSTGIFAVLAGFAVMKIAGVLGGQLVGNRRIDRKFFYVLVAANIAAIFGFAGFAPVVLIVLCFGIHVLLHIAISVYCQAEFQAVVSDDQRAGATSVVSLLSSFTAGAAAILVGVLADSANPIVAVLPSVVLYVIVALVTMTERS